jgi:hypothetical protein
MEHVRQWTVIDRSRIAVGDLVSAEAGGLPVYRVLALQDRRLWLREERTGRDHIVPVDAMRWTLAE